MVELTSRQLEDLRRLAVRVAGEAAAFLRDRFGLEELSELVGVHSHDSDESMRVDVESEKNIVELLKAEGFSGIFVGEEAGLVKLGGDPLVAIADPLDGSKNFASLVPWNAVSIALAPLDDGGGASLGDVVAGAVAPVFRWPVISFARGLGVFEGSSRLEGRSGRRSRLVMAYFERVEQARVVQRYLELVGWKRGVRALGSASLEIVWTAAGRAEVFIDVRGKLRTVDVAAALGAARELGARILVENNTANLTRVEPVGSVVVASSEEAWKHILQALSDSGYGWLASKTL